jgi:hypothetical protein
VGAATGARVGASVGARVGVWVGVRVGAFVGTKVGVAVGAAVVGVIVGRLVGFVVGLNVGESVGARVGASVGAAVGGSVHVPHSALHARATAGNSQSHVNKLHTGGSEIPEHVLVGVAVGDDVGAAVGCEDTHASHVAGQLTRTLVSKSQSFANKTQAGESGTPKHVAVGALVGAPVGEVGDAVVGANVGACEGA